MLKSIVTVLSIFGVINEAFGQNVVLYGQCNPSISAVQNFNILNFLGRWFEVERYPQAWQTGQCSRQVYSAGSSGAIDLLNMQVVSQSLQTQAGTAQVSSLDGSGHLALTFNVSGNISTANLIVLGTDYTSYALLYSCRNLNNVTMQVGSWKMSRDRTLTAQATAIIDTFIANSPLINQTLFQATNQSDEACFYIPDVNQNEVLFRGNCDNIVGQANFDMERYAGWWHEISSYPNVNQTGTCISSRYQLVNNVTSFVNTQVFNVTGQVVSGTVEVFNNSRLRRTWYEGNQVNNEDIWVLETDYDSYSVVLSCQTVDSEYVRVWSSQQSKSRSLTAAAQQAIVSVIARNNFLVSDLYRPVNQSDEACFHYPGNDGVNVVLPGQCDMQIPVQANFNMGQYAGTWYQIERYAYPEVSDNATCIGTRYTVSGAGVSVLSWQMLNGTLNTTEGQATVNGSALAVVHSENVNITANLFILATDYETYSLAYTCENINQFERVVVAFKLSRTRVLPANASAAIDSYMSTRQEFYQPYFITVEQNEDCVDPSSSFLVKSSIFIVIACYVINILM